MLCQVKTSVSRDPLTDNFNWNEEVQISTIHWMSAILNFIRSYSGNIYCFLITFPYWCCQFNSNFQNAQWSDEYSVYKINTDIHLMCEMHVTVNVYRAVCSFPDADSHF